MMEREPVEALIDRALQARAQHLEYFPSLDSTCDIPFEGALRLFNGFLEGYPDLAADLYAHTLVMFNYADDPGSANEVLERAARRLLDRLPWVHSVLVKRRNSNQAQERRGIVIHGQAPDRKVREMGVWYALDLTLNQDASLYLDTRNLRAWVLENLAGQSVLNTFAYTGSLGVAALAGGARRVVQLDRSRRFLDLARPSYALNGFTVPPGDFVVGDFWTQINRLKRAGELFDCVLVDPPFFSLTGWGRVDLLSDSQRVINKVRPLIGHGGCLVTINNALFLNGADYYQMLEQLCADGYMTLESLIPVPMDFTGFPETRTGQPPVDPSPFNHSTKIAILRVARKDQRTASR